MSHKLGYRPDPFSSADWEFTTLLWQGAVRAELPPAKASLAQYVPTILDQGPIGSCVANAGAQAIRIRHLVDGVESPELLSRLFAYYVVRGYIQTEAWDSGGHIRDLFRGLNYYGFTRESRYPYKTGSYRLAPPPELLRAAIDQSQPCRYWRIGTTGEARMLEIKRAISAGFPVVFGTDVGTKFDSWSGKGIIEAPALDEVLGGHALCAAAYDPDWLGGPNSWGGGWGDGGWFRISWDYALHPMTRDLWVVERAPYYSEAA